MRGGAGVQYLIGLEIFNIQKCWDGILPFLSGDPPPHQNCARIVGSSMKKKKQEKFVVIRVRPHIRIVPSNLIFW